MGILDFTKKEELEKIKYLEDLILEKEILIEQKENELLALGTKIEKISNENSNLNYALLKFEPIHKLEDEIQNKKTELDKLISDKEINLNLLTSIKKAEIKELETKFEILEKEYQQDAETYYNLKRQIKLYSEDFKIIDSGLYNPIFNFGTSEDYKESIRQNYEKQKLLIKENKAITSHDDEIYYVTEYKFLTTSYKKSINNYKKLILIAFNSECDALITKVKWNNINSFQSKIKDIFDRINTQSREFCAFILLQNSIVNRHHSSNNFETRYKNQMIEITKPYLELKLEELALYHEQELKKYEEKEEEKRIRELFREEEKARKDFEKATKEAEIEEVIVKKQLELAKTEALNNIKNDILNQRIYDLEEKLKAVQDVKARAISMAQQTKRGYIYIISNIGSFGENIFKIGMTRRLDPFERVRELGNASVPFKFDVHTMIYAEDAPSLENELHKTFSEKRINLYNHRREFFKIPLDDIEIKIKELNIEAEFIKIPEAMEYWETQSILTRLLNQNVDIVNLEEYESDFPLNLVKRY